MNLASRVLNLVALSCSTAFASGFLDPFEHDHLSRNGTPYVHSFGIEPAFTGRDLFLDQTYREGNGVTEFESELELEWSFTRRLGVIMEVPYIFEDAEDDSTASGLGGFTIVPRALLLESDRFLLTAQVELTLPTGSKAFGSDTAVAPGIAMWNDLGNMWTLNSHLAVEHVFDTDATELLYGIGLVKSFGASCDGHGEHGGHGHSDKGRLNLHIEATGSTPLDGDDDGEITIEGLVGFSYGLNDGFDIRAGYLFPVTSPHEFDHGFTAGLIIHF